MVFDQQRNEPPNTLHKCKTPVRLANATKNCDVIGWFGFPKMTPVVKEPQWEITPSIKFFVRYRFLTKRRAYPELFWSQFGCEALKKLQRMASCESMMYISCGHPVHEWGEHWNHMREVLHMTIRVSSSLTISSLKNQRTYLEFIAKKHTEATHIECERVIIKFALPCITGLI
jgi:hypothetical protein